MSYILDALNKAENERQLGGVPTLDSQHQAHEEIKPRRFWPVVIFIAILLNAILIGYLIYSRSNPGDNNESLTAAPSTTTNMMPLKQVEPVQAEPVLMQQALPKNNPPVAAKSKLSPTDIEAAEQAFDELLKENALSVPKIDQHQPVKDSIIVDRAVEKIKAEPESVASYNQIDSVDQDIPFLTDTPESFQTSVPDLVIDVHVFSKLPSKRFILVNLEKYQEDDHIAKGLLLEEITEFGLILSYQNQKFKWPMLTE